MGRKTRDDEDEDEYMHAEYLGMVCARMNASGRKVSVRAEDERARLISGDEYLIHFRTPRRRLFSTTSTPLGIQR